MENFQTKNKVAKCKVYNGKFRRNVLPQFTTQASMKQANMKARR